MKCYPFGFQTKLGIYSLIITHKHGHANFITTNTQTQEKQKNKQTKLKKEKIHTVGENIIGALKMLNNYGSI